jgi:hypothetical protein
VFATGLFSYATVLNAHVPAATLVLAAAACHVHLATAPSGPSPRSGCSAPGCAPRWRASSTRRPSRSCRCWPASRSRSGGGRGCGSAGWLLFLVGAAGPLALHASLTLPVTGDLFQGMGFAPPPGMRAEPTAWLLPDEPDEPRSAWRTIGQTAASVAAVLFGSHGLLSHFPVLVVGAVGVSMVMHRHWPPAAKVLAAATLAGAVFLLVAYAAHRPAASGGRTRCSPPGGSSCSARW